MTGAKINPALRLKRVKRVRSKGRDYYYFDTGRTVAGKKVRTRLPDINDPGFYASYAACLGHLNRAPAEVIRVPKLIALYQRSPEYRTKIKPSSQRIYDIYLARLEKLLPTAPVDKIERKDIKRLRDDMAATPGAANTFLAVVQALFAWAVDGEYMASNPADGISLFDPSPHEPWPEHILKAALASDNDRVRLLTHLLYYTAQRLNDVLDMTWNQVQGDRILVRQKKTDKLLSIPLHKSLKAELAKTPRAGLCIAATKAGKRMDEDTARAALKAFVAQFGARRVPHGLRKNAVIALIEAGCSVPETAAISGQSFKVVEEYAKGRDQAKLADVAMLRWEQNESGTGKTRENPARKAR